LLKRIITFLPIDIGESVVLIDYLKLAGTAPRFCGGAVTIARGLGPFSFFFLIFLFILL
jgi:hypothetical protein